MIILLAFLAGCAIGWYRAARAGGNTQDRIQYALAHGIPAALLALVFVIIGMRLGWGI